MTQELTFEMISKAAEKLNVEPGALDAVCRLESRGSGFLSSGKLAIRFEGHVFWHEMLKKGFAQEKLADLSQLHPNVLYPKRTKAFYLEGEREYQRLEEAVSMNEGAAWSATSWGRFRMMGKDYAACGYSRVDDFVEAQKEIAGQLDAFCNWLQSKGLVEPLRERNWGMFARLCYGPAYAQYSYDKKLENAYQESCREHGIS